MRWHHLCTYNLLLASTCTGKKWEFLTGSARLCMSHRWLSLRPCPPPVFSPWILFQLSCLASYSFNTPTFTTWPLHLPCPLPGMPSSTLLWPGLLLHRGLTFKKNIWTACSKLDTSFPALTLWYAPILSSPYKGFLSEVILLNHSNVPSTSMCVRWELTPFLSCSLTISRGLEHSLVYNEHPIIFNSVHPEVYITNHTLFFLMFVFIFERRRETDHEWGRGRERRRHRIRSRFRALSCQRRAWRGARTHKPWDRDLSWSQMLNWLSHPGAPMHYCYRHYFIKNRKSKRQLKVSEDNRVSDEERCI